MILCFYFWNHEWVGERDDFQAQQVGEVPRKRFLSLAEEDALSIDHAESGSCSEQSSTRSTWILGEQTRYWCKWENDDYIYRGHILNGMSYPLFDFYQNVENAKE